MTGGILYDADFVIALFIPHESTHTLATGKYSAFGAHSPFILRPIIYEIATVLSRKFGGELAHPIVRDLLDNRFAILDIDDVERRCCKSFEVIH